MVRRLLEPMQPLAPIAVAPGRDWVPACDVLTRGEDLIVRVELPGVDPEKDLEITLDGETLCIWGERRFDESEGGERYHRRKVPRGAFKRAVTVPKGLKPEDIKATYADGILEVTLPKAAGTSEAQRIPIQVGGQTKAIETGAQKAA